MIGVERNSEDDLNILHLPSIEFFHSYDDGKALCCANYGPKHQDTPALVGLNCTGTESALTECPVSGGYCSSVNVNYGSVYCYKGELTESESFSSPSHAMATAMCPRGARCGEDQ